MILKLLLTISLAFLVGCSGSWKKVLPYRPAEVVTETVYIQPDCGTPPRRAPVELRPITWRIIPNEKGEQGFWLSANGYEDLAFNTSEISKGSRELKAEIQYYINCLAREPEIPIPGVEVKD